MREEINLKKVVLTPQAWKTMEKFKQFNHQLYSKIKHRFCDRYLYMKTVQELHKYADIVKVKTKPRIYMYLEHSQRLRYTRA